MELSGRGFYRGWWEICTGILRLRDVKDFVKVRRAVLRLATLNRDCHKENAMPLRSPRLLALLLVVSASAAALPAKVDVLADNLENPW